MRAAVLWSVSTGRFASQTSSLRTSRSKTESPTKARVSGLSAETSAGFSSNRFKSIPPVS